MLASNSWRDNGTGGTSDSNRGGILGQCINNRGRMKKETLILWGTPAIAFVLIVIFIALRWSR